MWAQILCIHISGGKFLQLQIIFAKCKTCRLLPLVIYHFWLHQLLTIQKKRFGRKFSSGQVTWSFHNTSRKIAVGIPKTISGSSFSRNILLPHFPCPLETQNSILTKRAAISLLKVKNTYNKNILPSTFPLDT